MEQTRIIQLYAILLRLYPRTFQAQFGEDMCLDFAEVLQEISGQGLAFQTTYIARELLALSRAALSERILENRIYYQSAWQSTTSLREKGLVLALFLLPAFAIGWNNPHPAFLNWIVGFLAVLLLIGLRRGLPRWSMPYLGLLLSFVSFFFVFQWLADQIAPAAMAQFHLPVDDPGMTLIFEALWAGLMWLSLFVMTLAVLGFLALLRRFESVAARLSQDWTQASFILYSGSLVILLLAFEPYHTSRPFAVASLLCLATGAWLYLLSPQPWLRLTCLLAGVSMAMGAASLNAWPLAVLQNFSARQLLQAWMFLDDTGLLAARQPVVDWAWMMAAILLPAVWQLASQRARLRRSWLSSP